MCVEPRLVGIDQVEYREPDTESVSKRAEKRRATYPAIVILV